MKFIKFTMSKGEDFVFPIEKANRILNSPEQLVRITDEDGWTGETINKAHIISTKEDKEAARDHSLSQPRIEAPQVSEEERLRVVEKFMELRKNTSKLVADKKMPTTSREEV